MDQYYETRVGDAITNTYRDYYRTWHRDGSEDLVRTYLRDIDLVSGLGSYARPVFFPAVQKVVWIDYENSRVIWDGGSETFANLGITLGSMIYGSYGYNFYFISDGISQVATGKSGDSRILQFDWTSNTVTGSAPTAHLNPPTGFFFD